MEDRDKEAARAIKLGKPIPECDKPKIKNVPYSFEDGK